MPKQIRLKDVLDAMVKASIARVHALMTYTQPDALFCWGLFQGIDMTLRILFTFEELKDMAHKHQNHLKEHSWMSSEVIEKVIQDMRIDLAQEGMEAGNQFKRYEAEKGGQQNIVNLITELLKRWEPK